MSHSVEVRVLRQHAGDLGHQAEGTTYTTHQAHARELAVQGLVEVVEHKAEGLPAQKPPAAKSTKPKA